jgi:hypothetical protein
MDGLEPAKSAVVLADFQNDFCRSPEPGHDPANRGERRSREDGQRVRSGSVDPGTFKAHPGHELFTRSSDSGKTWSPAVDVGGSVGTLSDTEWWIDGDLSMDHGGNPYATWDTQRASGDSDIGWLSYSTDGGRTWSAPIRVTPDQDNAVHNVEVVGTRASRAVVAWQADNSPKGYATYLRPFSITRGWLAPVLQVSLNSATSRTGRAIPSGFRFRPQACRPQLGQRGGNQPELRDIRVGGATAITRSHSAGAPAGPSGRPGHLP